MGTQIDHHCTDKLTAAAVVINEGRADAFVVINIGDVATKIVLYVNSVEQAVALQNAAREAIVMATLVRSEHEKNEPTETISNDAELATR